MDKIEQLRITSVARQDVALDEGVSRVETGPRGGGSSNFEHAANSRLVMKPGARLVAMDGKSEAAAEFRLLAARLNKLKSQNKVKRILVAGCIAESGSSLVCANLALTLAQNPAQRVMLIEANLEHTGMDARFGMEAPLGLSEYLQDGHALESVVHRLAPSGIWFLSAGTAPRSPEDRVQVLSSSKLLGLFRQESDWFDWVLVDSPPLENWGTAAALTHLCDGLILVIRKGHTSKKVLKRTLNMLDRIPVLGYAINEVGS